MLHSATSINVCKRVRQNIYHIMRQNNGVPCMACTLQIRAYQDAFALCLHQPRCTLAFCKQHAACRPKTKAVPIALLIQACLQSRLVLCSPTAKLPCSPTQIPQICSLPLVFNIASCAAIHLTTSSLPIHLAILPSTPGPCTHPTYISAYTRTKVTGKVLFT